MNNGKSIFLKTFGVIAKGRIIPVISSRIILCNKIDVFEKLNWTLLKKLRSMVSQLTLPYEFWAEVVNTAVYLINNFTSNAINFLTSFELSFKRIVDYNCLRTFFCIPYPFIYKENIIKLNSTFKKCWFFGYANGVKDIDS